MTTRRRRSVPAAVLVVAGITAEGRREVLTWRVGDSESEETWGAVFDELNRRGVAGVEWVMSDAHRGLRAASRRVTLVSHLAATSCGKTRQIADRRDCRKVCVYL